MACQLRQTFVFGTRLLSPCGAHLLLADNSTVACTVCWPLCELQATWRGSNERRAVVDALAILPVLVELCKWGIGASIHSTGRIEYGGPNWLTIQSTVNVVQQVPDIGSILERLYRNVALRGQTVGEVQVYLGGTNGAAVRLNMLDGKYPLTKAVRLPMAADLMARMQAFSCFLPTARICTMHANTPASIACHLAGTAAFRSAIPGQRPFPGLRGATQYCYSWQCPACVAFFQRLLIFCLLQAAYESSTFMAGVTVQQGGTNTPVHFWWGPIFSPIDWLPVYVVGAHFTTCRPVMFVVQHDCRRVPTRCAFSDLRLPTCGRLCLR